MVSYVLVIVLTLLAILPALWPPITTTSKGLYVAAFVVLGAGAIIAQRFERRSDERERQADRDVWARILALQEQATVSAVVAAARLQQASGLPKASLKHRALALSDEILRFLVTQEQVAPYRMPERIVPGEKLPNPDPVTVMRYFENLEQLYAGQFSARVRTVRDDLERAGLQDPVLDRRLTSPARPVIIREIAERIGDLAQRLP